LTEHQANKQEPKGKEKRRAEQGKASEEYTGDQRRETKSKRKYDE
jgi:hypothetical protein